MKAETANESIALLDFTPDFKCESIHHEASQVHGGAAEFFQHGPCAGTTGYRCARVVREILSGITPIVPCDYCGERHGLSDVSFTPLSVN